MADHDTILSEFKAITQENDDTRARFFLETANWQLDMAMETYYDNSGGGMMDIENTAAAQAPPVSTGSSSVDADEFNRDDGLEAWMRSQKKTEESRPSKKTDNSASKPNKPASKYASLSDYVSAPKQDSDEEAGQEFYAGGSEHSGQSIVGPGKKKKDLVEQMFKDAKKHGAQMVDGSEPKQSKPTTSHFSGGGYKLGATETDHQFVPGREKPKERKLDVTLKLWSNGFTIDDEGPLREFNDPANKEFLDHIRKGEIPTELTKLAKGGVVNLDMEDHRNEEFKPPKKKIQAFTGQGHMLGSPTPQVVSTPVVPAQTGSVDPEVIVDSSAPVTSIQIRLADGTKVAQKFNHTHTIEDIRRLTISRNPASANRNFVLMTTFPSKELTDMSMTIKDANLLNTVVVQRYK